MSQTFVLIHGTWHGGWAWQDVVRHLSRRGHIAHTPTLAGHGRGAMPRGITHEDCVDSVVACIRHCNLENVVLVGHSFGGTVVQRVAARVPERIVRLVFVNALIVKDKERGSSRSPSLGDLARQLHPGRPRTLGTLDLGAVVSRAESSQL